MGNQNQNHTQEVSEGQGKPIIVVTNDDGVDSPFITILADVLSEAFEIRMVAPKSEKSWIGSAISRVKPVTVEQQQHATHPTWIVDGTPADCVNIALGSLFVDPLAPVSAVVSGVNIGYNASLSTILHSGTVGAAAEGALFGKVGFALSKTLTPEVFNRLQEDRLFLEPGLEESLKSDCRKVVAPLRQAIQEQHERSGEGAVIVHNFNFPYISDDDTSIVATNVARVRMSGLFQETKPGSGRFCFSYQKGENIDFRTKTDLNSLTEGHISYSKIDYSQLTNGNPESSVER